ncbi:MAG: hypothetical protein ACYS76_02915 [Planctomycetota bacterium]|jgi:hypothetical protein
MKEENAGLCEMCGYQVANRQKSHIVAEARKSGVNVLHLCPSCHIMFDTHVKPKICRALKNAGFKDLPKSWETSIYEQAAKASEAIRKRRS